MRDDIVFHTNGKLSLKGKPPICVEKYARIGEANFHRKPDNRRRIDHYSHRIRNEQIRKLR